MVVFLQHPYTYEPSMININAKDIPAKKGVTPAPTNVNSLCTQEVLLAT